MATSLSLVALLVILTAVLAWLLGRPAHAGSANPQRPEEDDSTDHELLEAAESELGELDAFTSPDDADEGLHDWGPGAPKP